MKKELSQEIARMVDGINKLHNIRTSQTTKAALRSRKDDLGEPISFLDIGIELQN